MWPEGDGSVAVVATASAGIAAATTAIVLPRVLASATRRRLLDVPGGRKAHEAPVPRLGGVAVVAGIALALALVAPAVGVALDFRLATTIGAVGLIFAVGVVDDLRGLSFGTKLVAEIPAAALLLALGWGFGVLRLPGTAPIELGAVGLVLSAIWIVGVTNAINWLDGVDGLAAGVVAIVAASLVVSASIDGGEDRVLVVTAAAIAGASASFLAFNWPPARLFLGDGGSLGLGFLLAALSARAATKPAALAVLVPLAALGVPMTDALLVVWRRFREASSASLAGRLLRVFRPDRTHLHHLLVACGLSARRVVWTIYALVLVSCALALAVAATQRPSLAAPLFIVQFVVVAAVRALAHTRRAAREATLTARDRPPGVEREPVGATD